jgi:hypothetical protein
MGMKIRRFSPLPRDLSLEASMVRNLSRGFWCLWTDSSISAHPDALDRGMG